MFLKLRIIQLKSRVKVFCRGIVQGIGFRPFVYRVALELNITGYVRNQGDAGVFIIGEGPKENLLQFIDDLQSRKPYLAKYEDFQVVWEEFQDEFEKFTIQKSSLQKTGGISYLPPDISICEECLKDLKNTMDSRFGYAFTSCAICGPRYTTITNLPYDRPNTTMFDFPFCPNCKKEYENPMDRRYHAQTTCCSVCGPSLSLYDKKGVFIKTKNTYKKITKLIHEGNIIAIKGIGGTHLACSAKNDETILRLRTLKGKRKYKPFALISKTINDIKSFTEMTLEEEKLLKSFRRPIVLLKKKDPFPLSEWISPNLFNVGVMLPYSGIHSLLLDELSDPAIILTSANPSDIPMFIENEEIFVKAGFLADYFLLHNRRIFQRADDSVIRLSNNNPVLIRRARGWVPEPINLPFNFKENISLGVGPLLTSTGAIIYRDRCFPTQHIGDINTLETLDFLESAIDHLASLLDIDVFNSIGRDLHPTFLSNDLALKYQKRDNSFVYSVQHHHAHAVALMIDNKIPLDDEIITIVADGVGYGDDGKIWGGEILHSNYTEYSRVGHLEEQPMIGGDRATYYPIRMFAGILSKVKNINEIAQILETTYPDSLPGGLNEIHVLLKQLDKKINIHYTTSTGRILAATSSLLRACFERTYEGEPAIVLESLAQYGKHDIVKFNLENSNSEIINTTQLIQQTFEKFKTGYKPADLAFAVHHAISSQFADLAIEYARNHNIKKIGFTGGVAYNHLISSQIAKRVKKAKLEFLQHRNLPCGDGAISSGQAIVAGLKKMK